MPAEMRNMSQLGYSSPKKRNQFQSHIYEKTMKQMDFLLPHPLGKKMKMKKNPPEVSNFRVSLTVRQA